MEKKFYFLLSLLLLLGSTTFAQFEQVVQYSNYPDVQHTSFDNLGSSVAISGNYVVVGTTEHLGIGAAYLFYNNGLTFDTLALLTPSNGNLGDDFGSSVAMHGDVIVIGADRNSDLGSNAGATYVFVKPSSGWEDMNETVQISAAGLNYGDYFGTSVDIEGDNIIVGSYAYENRGSAFIFEKPLGGWLSWNLADNPPYVLTASDRASSDYFGISVSISGDIIVAGAYGDDDNGSTSGSAYVFVKPSSGWETMTETAKLTASDAAASDYFGYSVSISGDEIVVGVYNDDDNGSASGSAYVFVKPSSGWETMTETAKLTASDGAASDRFGYSVSISNSVVAIGASRNADSYTGSGSVYIFEKPSSGWVTMTESAKMNPSNQGSNYQFGYSVSIDGDFFVAGSPYFSGTYEDSGAAFVFEKPVSGWVSAIEIAELFPRNHANKSSLRIGKHVAIEGNIAIIGEGFDGASIVQVMEFDGASWTELAQLTTSDGHSSDDFGASMSISGDVIVIGSKNTVDNGAAYVYEKPLTGWEDMTETAKLVSTDGFIGSHFGASVSISNDVIVVGAYADSENGPSSGSAYVFEKPVGSWVSATETAKLTASDGAAYNSFAYSLSLSNDVIVVGAYGDDENGSYSGSAYVYEKPSLGWATMTETAKLTSSDGVGGERLGYSTSISGEVIVVGAYTDDDNGSSSGSAYVFVKPSGSWLTATETAKLLASDGTSSDYFGYSVSISGDIIVSGAYGAEGTGVSHGAAYVFEKPSSGWISGTEDQILFASDENQYYNFAKSVAVSSNYILSGSPDANIDGFTDAGSTYLFQAPLTWTGATNDDWHTAGNWDCGIVPNFYDDVFIDAGAQPTITSEANSYDIEMAPTAQMYMVSSAVDNNSSLIFGGDFIGSESIQYRRYLQSNRWQMIGSPVSGLTINRFLTFATNSIVSSSGTYQMKGYDESSDSWTANYTSSTAGDLELAKGYVVERATDGQVYFEGEPNNEAVNISLTRDGSGWNLIGNPFTSAIAATVDGTDSDDYLLNTGNVSVLDPSYAALYIWVEDINDRSNLDNYKVINNAASGSLVQDYLQVGQGFFVKSKSGGGSFAITPAMQSHQTAVAFKQTANTSWAGIKLIAESAESKTSTQVSYQETMTRGLDVGYDAGLFNSNPNFALYSKLIDDNGVDFMLQCLPSDYEHLVVPIGLDAEAGSTIIFKAEVSNLPEDYVAVLEDRENGTFTAFETEQSVYTVNLENASTGTGRFYLHTRFKSTLDANGLDQVKLSVFTQSSSNLLVIDGNVEENTTAKVYDIRGKLVKTFDLQMGTQNRLLFNEQPGVYIIQIQNSKGIVSEKVNWVK